EFFLGAQDRQRAVQAAGVEFGVEVHACSLRWHWLEVIKHSRGLFNPSRRQRRCAESATMKICVVSDSHDRAEPLAQAVREAKAQDAEAVIHCGDLIGAQSLKHALEIGLPI